jgi:hypothetical protein
MTQLLASFRKCARLQDAPIFLDVSGQSGSLRRPGRRCPQDLLLVLLGLQTVRFDRSQWRLCLLIRNSLHITRTFYLLILWPYLRPLLVYLLTIPRLPVFIINSLYSNPVAAVGSHVCHDIDVKYWFRQQTTISLNVSKILTICWQIIIFPASMSSLFRTWRFRGRVFFTAAIDGGQLTMIYSNRPEVTKVILLMDNRYGFNETLLIYSSIFSAARRHLGGANQGGPLRNLFTKLFFWGGDVASEGRLIIFCRDH